MSIWGNIRRQADGTSIRKEDNFTEEQIRFNTIRTKIQDVTKEYNHLVDDVNTLKKKFRDFQSRHTSPGVKPHIMMELKYDCSFIKDVTDYCYLVDIFWQLYKEKDKMDRLKLEYLLKMNDPKLTTL